MSQVITNAFEQYWQSSLAAEQPVVLDEFILADIPNLDITAPIDPDTVLPPESQIVHRQSVDQRGRINNNAVAYTIVMDTTVGDFSFNAMYLRNKQNGVIGMIVYKGRETKLKTDQTTGQTGNSLVKSMLMGYDQAAEATLTNVDAGTWQIDYAARLRGQDEDLRQLASQLYGHHTFIGDGFKVVQQDGGHQVTPGVAIVGGLRVELNAPEVIYPGSKPIGVWVDVHRAGSLLSEHQNHFTIITSVADLADHVDGSGYQHFVAKLATVQTDSTVLDGRRQEGSSGTGGIPDTFALWRRSMAEAGYDLIGRFGTKHTIQNAKQVLLSKDGTEVYAWMGDLPKDVDKNATLENSGGVVDGAWKRITGESLRSALIAINGELHATQEWSTVPAHSDSDLGEAMNEQAQALINRFEYLSGPMGAGKLGHRMSGAEEKRSIGAVLSDRAVSPVDHGAMDDYDGTTGTNNLNAFKKTFELLNANGGGDLYLPKNGNGKYFINGDDTTKLQYPVRICADEGVSIHLIYSGGKANSPLVNTTLLTANRQLKIQYVNFGFTSFVGKNIGKELGDILPTANNGDGVFSIPESLSGSDFKIFRLDNMVNEIDAVSSTTDSVTYAGAGTPTVGVIGATAGDEVMSLVSSSAGGVFLAGVITANGFAYVAQNSGDFATKRVEGTFGFLPVLDGVQYALMDQERDLFNHSLLSIKVTSDRSYSMMVNGLVVGSYDTRSSIIGVCFGTENVNANVSISQMSKVTGRSFGGSKPLKLLISGDSITDDSAQYSWAKYLQMILGSAGINIAEINNISVAGQTAEQQHAILKTVGATYDLCLIQIGVNDIQGGTSFSSFVETIKEMVTYAKTIGAQPIVGIPTSFYSKAEANANGQVGGQDTLNNNAIHTYRALLIRAVAEAGGIVNLEPMKAFGAITAKWLSLTPYAVSDRIVVDNIHPSPYGSMMLAQGWARSVIGYLNRPDISVKENYEVLPSSWLSDGFGETDKPLIKGRRIKGVISLNTTSIFDGVVAFKLPPFIKIDAIKMTAVTAANINNLPIGVANLYIGMDGSCCLFNIPSGAVKISLDGVEV